MTSEDEPEMECLECVLKEHQNGIKTIEEQLEITHTSHDKIKQSKRPTLFSTSDEEEGSEHNAQEPLMERFSAHSVIIDKDKFPNRCRHKCIA